MINFLLVLNIIVVLLMIGIILLQKSEGGVLGMGGGSKGAMFTAAGAGNMITKVTYFLAACFFVICFALAILVSKENKQAADGFIKTMERREGALEVKAIDVKKIDEAAVAEDVKKEQVKQDAAKKRLLETK